MLFSLLFFAIKTAPPTVPLVHFTYKNCSGISLKPFPEHFFHFFLLLHTFRPTMRGRGRMRSMMRRGGTPMMMVKLTKKLSLPPYTYEI